MTEKTIPEYKNIIKILKLKVMQQKKQIEDLEMKIQHPQEQNNLQSSGSIVNESQLMGLFLSGCRRLGTTPEAIFRQFDKEYSQKLLSDDFRNQLSSAKLGLTQGQSNRIAHMADEDCIGTITYQGWLKLLQIHQINQEKASGNKQSIAQESMTNFAKFLISINLSANSAYDKLDKGGQIKIDDLRNLLKKNLNENEIVSVFNYLDVDKMGSVDRSSFVGEIQRFMTAISKKTGKSLQEDSNQVVNRMNNASSIHSQAKSVHSMKSVYPQALAQLDPQDLKLPSVNAQELIPRVMKKLKIDNYIDYILSNLQNPALGITSYDIFKAFENSNAGVSKADQQLFFLAIDKEGNGVISYENLLDFYCKMIKDGTGTSDKLFDIKIMQIKAETTQDMVSYVKGMGIENETQLDQQSFLKVSSKMFYDQEKLASQKIYENLQEQNKVEGKNLILKLQTAENKKFPKSVKKDVLFNKDSAKSAKNALANMKMDVDEMETVLKAIVKKDNERLSKVNEINKFKARYCEENITEVVEIAKETILKDEKSALLKCYEIVKKLNRDKKSKWSDPEFGPVDGDNYGAQSLYYAENEKSEGAPKPEDLKWLRPEEIIELYSKCGNKSYEGKQPIFIDGGASSNDVKQSAYLGDCYFISALSLVASDDRILRGSFDPRTNTDGKISDDEFRGLSTGVWPPMFHAFSQYGIYVIRLFKDFGWTYTLVDDRIPCKVEGEPEIVYGKCTSPTELWVSIIEKAYAKIHNNYQQLISGDISQSLADMTGKVADKVKIQEKIKNPADIDALWARLNRHVAEGTLMGCSSQQDEEGFMDHPLTGEETGLLGGHAYSIQEVFELDIVPYELERKIKKYEKIKKENEEILQRKKDDPNNKEKLKPVKEQSQFHKHRIVKLRNPWGHGEWKLKWSEGPEKPHDTPESDQRIFILKYKLQLDKMFADKKASITDPIKLEELEEYKIGIDDGTFLMNYKNWREIFTTLFVCIDFPDIWSGQQIISRWTPERSFGIIKKNADYEKNCINFAEKNPQFILNLNRKEEGNRSPKEGIDLTNIYIQLIQTDGRLFWGEKYPFGRVQFTIFLGIFRLESNETKLEKFVQSKIVNQGSTMQLKREIDSEFIKLKNGKYAIIACTKNQGELAPFTIRIYYDCDKSDISITSPNMSPPDFSVETIQEEEEEAKKIDPDFKKLIEDAMAKALGL